MNCNICGSNNSHKKFSLTEFDVLKCKECGLVFLSQIPTEETLKSLYSSDYYMERKEYFNSSKGKEDIFSGGLERLNSLKPDKGRLLDVGCGVGNFLYMAKMNGWDVCGIDISAYAVKHAEEKFGLEVYNSAQLREVAFPSNSFDAITLWDSLEHFPDPMGQLKQIHRVLKSDGLILLNAPNEASLLRIIASFLYVITGERFTYPVRKLYHHYHIYYFGPVALQTLLQAGGFEIISLEENTIPIVKARGSYMEKSLVKLLSYAEKAFGMEYELFAIAGMAANMRTRGGEVL